MSLGVSVDIVKSAVEKASIVIEQVNSYMPVSTEILSFILMMSISSFLTMNRC